MPFFRKKPIIIEAFRFTDETKNRVFNWVTTNRRAAFENDDFENGDPCMYIDTLEGEMKVSIGDWVIKGVNGEFYPCKADIFEKTYEIVKEDKC